VTAGTVHVSAPELSMGRVDPRVGSGRVGLGRVGSVNGVYFLGRVGSGPNPMDWVGSGPAFGGSGRIGSRFSGSAWVVYNFSIYFVNNIRRKS